MRRSLLIVGTILAAAATAAHGADLRLTPAEIAALPALGAVAGTSGTAGTVTRVLAGDPSAAGPYTIALQVPANTRIAAHRHRDARSVVVVSGDWSLGFGDVADDGALKRLPPGSFYTEPAGVMHFARTGPAPVTVYISGFGPTDTVYDKAP